VEEKSLGDTQEPADLDSQEVLRVVNKYINEKWNLRAGQAEAIVGTRKNKHCVCCLPTASGKTLVMAAPGLLDYEYGIAGIHIICQPLDALRSLTHSAFVDQYFRPSSMPGVVLHWPEDGGHVSVDDLDDGHKRDCVQYVFVSPEQLGPLLQGLRKRGMVRALRSCCLDEVHLRFSWHFRDYTATDYVSSHFPDTMLCLLSATLNARQIHDLKQSMGLRPDCYVVDQQLLPQLNEILLKRVNQQEIVVTSHAGFRVQLLKAAQELADGEQIIVYVRTYNMLSNLYLSGITKEAQLSCLHPTFYHASLSTQDKLDVVNLFSLKKSRLIFATVAFGVGLNFTKIAEVHFLGAPSTLVDYLQLSGRAGRDAPDSRVRIVLCWSASDLKNASVEMRSLCGYSGPLDKSKTLECPLCKTRNWAPKAHLSGSNIYSGRCFEYDGTHCKCKMPSCLQRRVGVMLGVFAFETLEEDLRGERKFQCGCCSVCEGMVEDESPEWEEGDLVQVKDSQQDKELKDSCHVVITGADGSVLTKKGRVRVRSTKHGVDRRFLPVNLKLVSKQHAVPEKGKQPNAQLDTKTKQQRLLALTAQLKIVAVRSGDLNPDFPTYSALIEMSRSQLSTAQALRPMLPAYLGALLTDDDVEKAEELVSSTTLPLNPKRAGSKNHCLRCHRNVRSGFSTCPSGCNPASAPRQRLAKGLRQFVNAHDQPTEDAVDGRAAEARRVSLNRRQSYEDSTSKNSEVERFSARKQSFSQSAKKRKRKHRTNPRQKTRTRRALSELEN
jgi:hypothetical protein